MPPNAIPETYDEHSATHSLHPRRPQDRLSEAAHEQPEIHILQAFGFALGALEGEPTRMIRTHLADFGG